MISSLPLTKWLTARSWNTSHSRRKPALADVDQGGLDTAVMSCV